MAARDTSDQLTGRQITSIASLLARDKMKIFAQGFLRIDETALSHLADGNEGAPVNFNTKVLNSWAYRSIDNNVRRLAELLYAAIDEHGLADPPRVEEILGVPVPNSLLSTRTPHPPGQISSTYSVSWSSWLTGPWYTELKKLAKVLRPNTAKTMKMEVAPWIQDYVVDMDDLYCELTLEKVENKILHENTQRFLSYEDCFESGNEAKTFRERLLHWFNNGQSSSGKKVLIKANPGMGKTTLVKRITYDWGKGVFTKVTLVLFVFLKLVRPGDLIENVIIDQNPVLEGMGVTPDRLREILETFGSSCLLVLDGMDEHAKGSDSEVINQDVMNIIQGPKFQKCYIILTSRPHTTLKYEKYFDTIVRVDGFTRSEAKKFAMKILQDEHMTKCVLEFNPSGALESPMYNCPILLSFLCLLVREEGVRSLDTNMDKGEIYARMVRCLYKKYTKHSTKMYADLIRTLKCVGKIAYDTLLSGKALFKRSEVVKEVGQDIFDVGLLIGHEDHRIVGTGDADIFIAFHHRSLQEFLGAFYYVWRLSEGDSVESLVGLGDKPFFVEYPLFFEFCLWFLFHSKSDLEAFILDKRDKALAAMSQNEANRIGTEQLSLYEVENIKVAFAQGKMTLQEFYRSVLEKCHNTKSLVVWRGVPVDWVMSCLLKDDPPGIEQVTLKGRSRYSTNIFDISEKFVTAIDEGKPTKLRSIDLSSGHRAVQFSNFRHSPGNQFESISLYRTAALKVLGLLKKWKFTEVRFGDQKPVWKQLVAFAVVGDYCKLPDLKALNLMENKRISGNLFVLSNYIWSCLIELNLRSCDLLPKDLTSLTHTKLPFLKVLYIGRNPTISGNLSALFSSDWPGLEKLDLGWCKLKPEDLISLALAQIEGKLPDLKVLILQGNKHISGKLYVCLYIAWLGLETLVLSWCDLKPEDLISLALAQTEEKLPDLKALYLLLNGHISGNLSALLSTAWPGLEELALGCCDLKPKDLTSLPRAKAEGKLPDLKVLDLQGNKQISGMLYACLHTAWLGLEILVLSRCDLKPEDLTSLGQAKAEGMLPDLKVLDLKSNKQISGNLSTLFSTAWPGLQELVLSECNLKPKDLRSLTQAKAEGKLLDLKVLKLKRNIHISGILTTLFFREWPRIQNMDLREPKREKWHGDRANIEDGPFNHEWPLKELDMSWCDLKPQDISSSPARAMAEGIFPNLNLFNNQVLCGNQVFCGNQALCGNRQISGNLN